MSKEEEAFYEDIQSVLTSRNGESYAYIASDKAFEELLTEKQEQILCLFKEHSDESVLMFASLV